MTPHLLLDGAPPVERLSKAHQRVLEVAQVEFLPASLW